jgi:hypothetical protein
MARGEVGGVVMMMTLGLLRAVGKEPTLTTLAHFVPQMHPLYKSEIKFYYCNEYESRECDEQIKIDRAGVKANPLVAGRYKRKS